MRTSPHELALADEHAELKIGAVHACQPDARRHTFDQGHGGRGDAGIVAGAEQGRSQHQRGDAVAVRIGLGVEAQAHRIGAAHGDGGRPAHRHAERGRADQPAVFTQLEFDRARGVRRLGVGLGDGRAGADQRGEAEDRNGQTHVLPPMPDCGTLVNATAEVKAAPRSMVSAAFTISGIHALPGID